MKLNLKLTKKQIKSSAKNIAFCILGTFILAFGIEIFMVQSKLVTGGMSGIAIILDQIIKPESSQFEIIVTIETWAFFISGFFVLGKEFTIKTLISTIFYPIFIVICSKIAESNFLYLDKFYASDNVTLLSCVFGGAFIGTGVAFTFLGGGSTGGTDILALSFCKIFKKLKPATAVFITDGLVIIFALTVLKDITLTLLGIVSAFVSMTVNDKIFLGNNKAYTAEIITNKSLEITQAVIERLNRTTTIFDAQGGYTKENKKMVLLSFKKNEYNKVVNIIKDIDPQAFILVDQAYEIAGEGWTYNVNKDMKKDIKEENKNEQ